MKIGIIGSGDVGRTLGQAFLSEGHAVMLGTRNTSKPEVVAWKKDNPSGETGIFSEAAKFGELLVIAIEGPATEAAVRLAGPENFSGKTVIDVTNPITNDPPVNGVLKFFTGPDGSLMKKIQVLAPGAKLVKAFNSVGNTLMYKPNLPGGTPTMFICGDDEAAKRTVTEILLSFGWEVEDMGKAEAAGAIESLCILWCIPGFLRNDWTHAFKLLKA